MYNKILCFLLLCIVAAFCICSRSLIASPLFQTQQTLIYEVGYANVPALTFYDLTLKLDVGAIADATVSAGGIVVPHTYNSTNGLLQFTADASPIKIVLTDPADLADIGPLEKVALKDDKKWAWSIGFDDNVELESTFSMFETYGYRGTIYQIASLIDDTRDEQWITDKIDMIAYLENGWSLGNHTWDHACDQDGDLSVTISAATNRIAGIIAESNRADYKLISFAAPCFDSAYHPYILNIRDADTMDLQFNESGGDFPLVVDAEQTSDFVLNGRNVYSFNFDRQIARDSSIEYDVAATIAEVDWIAAHTSPLHHFWYNSLAHGDNLNEVQQVTEYIYNTYGTNGTDEVWVAPADHIYSYLLVREKSTIALVDSYVGAPTATPTLTAADTPTIMPIDTSIPTATYTPTVVQPTNTPEPTDTPVPTDTPTPVVSNLIGDATCDEMVNAIDALAILQFSVSIRSDGGSCPLADPITMLNATRSDVNNSGAVDAIDALFILQCTVALPNSFCPGSE